MGEVSVNQAVELISSTRIKDRTDGLGDLKHILLQNRRTSRLDSLDDKGYHKIFEALFRFVSIEKSIYNRANKPASKTQSGSRLSSCSSVLRITVELGLRTLRAKTVTAIVYHITEALPIPGEGLWEPLSHDYLRSLRSLLEYPPHVEHLGRDDWRHLIDFCLRSIGIAEPDQGSQLSFRSDRRLRSENPGPASGRSTSPGSGHCPANNNVHSDLKNNAEELEVCIELLTTPPGAPILDDAEKLLNGLTEYLLSLTTIGRPPHAAFGALNAVLAKIITDNTALVQDALLNVLLIVRRLWPTKSAVLREEMLIAMILGRDILARVGHSPPLDSFIESIQGLVEQLYQGYLKQLEKDILQIDDLLFPYHHDTLPMGIQSMAPRLGIARTEQNWAILWAIASFSRLLDELHAAEDGASDDQVFRKKPRLLSRTNDILREASSSAGLARICALQLVPFMLSESDPDAECLSSLLDRLTVNILDESGLVASWTMVAIASIASCGGARSGQLSAHWTQVWDLASRCLAIPVTSRVACNLMAMILHFKLLDYSTVVGTIETMVSSIGFNGPSNLTDSALSLWAIMMEFRTKANPNLGQDTSRQICGWLKNTWTLGTLADRLQTAQIAAFARPVGLLSLLMTCTGRPPIHPATVIGGALGRISRAWLRYRENEQLMQYLLLIDKDKCSNKLDHGIQATSFVVPSTSRRPNDQVVLELLQTKVDSFIQFWTSICDEKSHHITPEIIQIFASLCMVTNIFIECLPAPLSSRSQGLQRSTTELWTNLCALLPKLEVEFTNACLEVLAPLLLSVEPPFAPNDIIFSGLHRIAPPLIVVLEQRRNMDRTLSSYSVADLMDLDDHFPSQESRFIGKETISKFDREDLPIPGNINTFRLAMTIQLSVFYRGGNTDNQFLSANGSFIDYLASLDEADILACRPYLAKFFLVRPDITREDACRLVEYFGEKCLEAYEFERCEASLCACITVMKSFVELWTANDCDSLVESASDVYVWLTNVIVGKRLGSPRVLIRIADLLEAMLRVNPLFSKDSPNPSPRTILFRILQDGDLTVKFHVARIIPGIFDQFVLKEHEAIFDDILESLPRDSDWDEGIALRLYLLARLASRWHTLLRRSIYHMFETPGQVPRSTPFAKACLRDVSEVLGLRDAREIFRLFSSQILYTWMETQSLTSIPYTVFGYHSLKDLLWDVQDEIVAQIVMRPKNDDATNLSSCLETSFQDLLSKAFQKAEAYSIARDISTPPSHDSQPKGAESRMKTLLGTDRFLFLAEKCFPETVATLFRCADQTEQIEKAFAKRPAFRFALDIWTDITGRCTPSATLPANQQPSFRARYLLDEIEFLCKRTGYDLYTMWNPALVCFVSRALLESIHPALGSLHACSVLRKLRILVCLAGSTILQDYPLEMLLHSLRPFLTDFQCSEDALGMFWYLVDKGKVYLLENPSFMTGLAVSTLASLKGFLASSQESTTQESHFRATLSKAQSFHNWFVSLLNNYRSPIISEESERSFRNIIRSSQKIQLTGNASKGTYESELIMELLQDKISGRNLLRTPAADLVFSLLCETFQRPNSFRDDILGEDQVAIANAVVVWDSVQNNSHGPGYRLWAARALGRAYAATGLINDSLLREQRSAFNYTAGGSSSISSKVAILRILCDSLFSNNQDIGLAERTLQIITSKLPGHPELEECENAIPVSLMKALAWAPYQCPDLVLSPSEASNFHDIYWTPTTSASEWARNAALCLALKSASDPVIGALQKILYTTSTLATQLLPLILHEVLLSEFDGNRKTRQEVSSIFQQAFCNVNETTLPHVRLMINCILYLRHQQFPNEVTMDERDGWLEIDYMEAAATASQCRMYKTSLLFLEIHASHKATFSHRTSATKSPEPLDLLHVIFKNIDDPDLFYGVEQDVSLRAVMANLEHEGSGFKNLSFQSANYDVDIKLARREDTNAFGIVKALNTTNLQGIASTMSSVVGGNGGSSEALESMLSTALDLQQWDIPVPETSSAIGSIFGALQNLVTSDDKVHLDGKIDECFLGVLSQLSEENQSLSSLRSSMRALGVLTEVDEVLSLQSFEEVQEGWKRIMGRGSWLKFESFQDISPILSSHEALFSSINRLPHLKSMLKLSSRDAQLLEVQVIRESLRASRDHDVLQASLKSAILLSKLVQPCAQLGITINAAATFDLANVLWDHGEMTASIRMLQQLKDQKDLHRQSIPVNRAEILASLGHHIAEARLEKPDAIIQNYLVPAIQELKGNSDGFEAGRVFHEFAAFCDRQLQNADGLEDFRRIEQLRHRKEKEVIDLEQMMKTVEGKERDQLRIHRTKAKQWFDLDDREYQRLKQSREAFLQQCLENYLLCLKACDAYGNDALRFCALWLDNSDNELANAAVSEYIAKVPSRKFASLMNQLSSRLLDVRNGFQTLLFELVFRICVEHPYHGMYQIFASSKSKGGKDQTALARHQAAAKLVEQLRNDRKAGATWVAIHNTNISYVRFAAEKLDEKAKSGSKVLLKKSITGQRLEQDVARQKIPPPTMKIPLRADCDYSHIPRLVKFVPEFTVASGVSAPKIVTAIASDGLRYKQLFKSGNDDLRQDSIMEQVFEQVSNLLRDHRTTRQRNLGIRTYKVLPLTANAGIIEFVQDTIPLHDYLMPAHQKHFPKDMKPNACRKHINDAQTKSVEHRVKVFRQVIDHFHPVMRFFFMEHFNNPDDWFSKRLAYTRSTAAISILGHVLGLGDRHGHNILLDKKTGEVVHIDLGVAFEQGRVLPVPEVVPFRLTRDLIDGMGTTKTEGVFRRCCEFTLDALRQDSYSIMTILDVLRYDPLYSWSLSPLRVKKMQDTQEAGAGVDPPSGVGKAKSVNEPSEADRALTVVAKKLGKTLSVTATVNELIQQATDERNLAVLYCGWAAYA